MKLSIFLEEFIPKKANKIELYIKIKHKKKTKNTHTKYQENKKKLNDYIQLYCHCFLNCFIFLFNLLFKTLNFRILFLDQFL